MTCVENLKQLLNNHCSPNLYTFESIDDETYDIRIRVDDVALTLVRAILKSHLFATSLGNGYHYLRADNRMITIMPFSCFYNDNT